MKPRPRAQGKKGRRRSDLDYQAASRHRLEVVSILPTALLVITLSLAVSRPALAAPPEEPLLMGQAHFMSGRLAEAIPSLNTAAESSGPESGKALYLLGRIYLLTGKFRRSKEYFERALEKTRQGTGEVGEWKSLAGIGDALYASGRYKDAMKRYRLAELDAPAFGKAHVQIKMALCDLAEGRRDDALERLKNALPRVPILSRWIGKEEDFLRSLAMQGTKGAPERIERYHVLVGPVKRDTNDLASSGIGIDIPVQVIRNGGEYYLDYGPFADPVEAMIYMEKVKGMTPYEARIQEK